jgi:hypothetical protein
LSLIPVVDMEHKGVFGEGHLALNLGTNGDLVNIILFLVV